MSVKDIVDAMYSGDTAEMSKSFNDEMLGRISSVIDVYKAQIADEIFNGPQESYEDEEVEDTEEVETD